MGNSSRRLAREGTPTSETRQRGIHGPRVKAGLFEPLGFREIVLIAMVAALSMAMKPYVHSIFAPVTGLVGVPVGVLAGALYMFWLVLANYLVNRAGAVLLLSFLQGVLAILLGMTGKLGAMVMVSYLAPGVAMELLFLGLSLFWRYCRCTPYACVASGAVANVAGSAAMSVLLFGLKPAVVLAGSAAAAITGGVGGLFAFVVGRRLEVALGSLSLWNRAGKAGRKV